MTEEEFKALYKPKDKDANERRKKVLRDQIEVLEWCKDAGIDVSELEKKIQKHRK